MSSVILLGVVALAGSLLWSMPLRFAVRQLDLPVAADRVSGTWRHGAVTLGGGHDLTVRVAAWDSLRRAGPVIDWAMTGPGTDLAGRLALPLPPAAARAGLGPVTGTLGWPLVAALWPESPVRCNMAAGVTDLRVVLIPGARSASGRIGTPAGRCTPTDGASPAIPVPALDMLLSQDAGALVGTLTRVDVPDVPLATLRLTDADRVLVTIHPAGAALMPGMPASADTELDLPLTALLP